MIDFKKMSFRPKNGKMLFVSGYKKFDRAVDLILHGNVMSNVQKSFEISSYKDTLSPSGLTVEEGRLQKLDLGLFSGHRIPYVIKTYIKEHPNDSFWLYLFRVHKDDIGWVLTDHGMNNVLVEVVNVYGRGSFSKRCLAIHEAEKYIVRGEWE